MASEDRTITLTDKKHFVAVAEDLAERFVQVVFECQIDAHSACMRIGCDLEDIIRLSKKNMEVKVALQAARKYTCEGIRAVGRGGDSARKYFAQGLAASGFYEKLFSIAAMADPGTDQGKNDLFMLMRSGAIKATIPHEQKLSVENTTTPLDKMSIEELQKELAKATELVNEKAKTLEENNTKMHQFSKDQVKDAEFEKAE